MTQCTCFIVPNDVLHRLSIDKRLSAKLRKASAHSAQISEAMRGLRERAALLTSISRAAGAHVTELSDAPLVTVYDCKHTQTLPGTPVKSTTTDQSAKRVFKETANVAKFYETVFGRNSADDAGMTLMSSIHFGESYNNAMWNGSQMVYGDGDNNIFVDFTKGNDVIGHELTHGVTQHSLQLSYIGDAGGLNESLSDCFGSMFRQWEGGQDAKSADWLIGSDIVGPGAKKRGIKALRNMAKPDDKALLVSRF